MEPTQWAVTGGPTHISSKGGLVIQTRPTSLESDTSFHSRNDLTILVPLQLCCCGSCFPGPGKAFIPAHVQTDFQPSTNSVGLGCSSSKFPLLEDANHF